MEQRKEYILEGLNCANCAQKIEDQVSNLSSVSTVSVNYLLSKMTIEHEQIIDEADFDKKLNTLVKTIEPDIKKIHRLTDQDKVNDHSHEHGQLDKRKYIQFSFGAILFIVGLVFSFSYLTEFLIFASSYLCIGYEVIWRAVKNIFKGQWFDENFLMSIATLGAFAISQFPEAVAVMLFYQIGEFFQGMAVRRSRKSIVSLMNIRPDYAHVKINEEFQTISPEKVNIGDTILIKAGERVPLDAVVIEGNSTLDTSALTGESVPKKVTVGDLLLSGTINQSGLLVATVKQSFQNSTVSKILDLVQNASSKKAPTEQFITKFARYYTPVIVFLAITICLIPPLFFGESFSEWFRRALVFLVVSCPCALVISIPLGFFGGIGAASRHGILVKGGNYLEALNQVDTVVFDKTGTLTEGIFQVTELIPEAGFHKDDLLKYAAYAEYYSNHPIATAIKNVYQQEVDSSLITDYQEISGHGITLQVNEKEVLAGNAKLIEQKNINIQSVPHFGTIVHIAIDKQYAGYLVISDQIKTDSLAAIRKLANLGIKKTVMLTGDNQTVGEQIAQQLKIDEVYTNLLPDQKVKILEEIRNKKSSKGKLVFVGDGVNDAPVLAYADIGVAMGGLGSDAAIEAADVVLMQDQPSKLVTAIKLAKRTKQIVWQNIVFSFSVKAVVLILGAGGLATIWEAVFADVGVALIAIMNAMRLIHTKVTE